MKRILVVLLFSILFSGCGTSANQPDFEGHIVEKKDGQVLLVENITAEDIKTLTVQEILEKASPNAAWISVKNTFSYSGLSVGDEVSVWIKGGVDGSYPAQAAAKKIKKRKSST